MKVRQTKEDKDFLRMVGENVKYYRLHNNRDVEVTDKFGRISQEKLAELSGTSASMIANIEAEHVDQTMSISFVRKIAKALNIPVYAFFLDEPLENPPKKLPKDLLKLAGDFTIKVDVESKYSNKTKTREQ